jgi:hypothetical protein
MKVAGTGEDRYHRAIGASILARAAPSTIGSHLPLAS